MNMKRLALGSVAIAALGLGGFGAAATVMGGAAPSVEKALAERLPNTTITAVDCDEISNLCAVEAGENLFYVDHSARFLVVGRIYDMETKQDLTAARLLEMNPDMLLGSAAATQSARTAPAAGDKPSAPSKIDAAALAALPSSGAIVHGSGKHRVTVFSDMRCGYCRQLYDTLSGMDVKVVERPISVLGTRPLSEKVICSSDPRRALKQAYAGDDLAGPGAKDCDTSGLDANEAFARQNGFTGSPVIVREDGEFLAGFRPKDVLDQWLNEGEVQ